MNVPTWIIAAASAVTVAFSSAAGALTPTASTTTDVEKTYSVGGQLRIGGSVAYSISNANGTITVTVGSVENDSPTTASGPIRLRVILTSAPINGGAFNYYMIGEGSLDPLQPQFAYTNFTLTLPLFAPPDGTYYVYVGVFEQEAGCASAGGFCVDDYISFANRLSVMGGVFTVQGADPASANAIEYYHAQFGHYFFTAIQDEISKLDSGFFQGWTRTGRSFGVWAYDIGGTAAVCRFFSTSFGPKSSHFYTPLASECEIVKNNPDWQYEGIVAYVDLPLGDGTCPTGIPLYRLYNQGMGGAPNHRYTTSEAIRADMIANGWIPEGYGAIGVIACLPY